jgi:hypothetical protein
VNWSDWLIVGWLVFGFMLMLSVIGKPRKPVEPSTAVVAFVIDAILIGCLLWGHGALS